MIPPLAKHQEEISKILFRQDTTSSPSNEPHNGGHSTSSNEELLQALMNEPHSTKTRPLGSATRVVVASISSSSELRADHKRCGTSLGGDGGTAIDGRREGRINRRTSSKGRGATRRRQQLSDSANLMISRRSLLLVFLAIWLTLIQAAATNSVSAALGPSQSAGSELVVMDAKSEALLGSSSSSSSQQQQQQTNNNDNQRDTGSSSGMAASSSQPNNNNNNNNDVIIIKYANHTAAPSNVYKLFEPLSVALMQSKFSQSIHLFDVSHNQLSTLPKDLFCPLSNDVRLLNLSHNLLQNFDCLGLISQAGQLCLIELQTLDMSHNLIRHLPSEGVAVLRNLEVLDLSHNRIEALDEISLESLYKLTHLDLAHNRIQQLPSLVFHKSRSLRVLRLQFNRIQTSITPHLLATLSSLEELNLSFNNISQLADHAFLDKTNLSRVDLSHNQLSGLRQEALLVTGSGSTAPRYHHLHAHLQLQPNQAPPTRPRLYHNGQLAGLVPVRPQGPPSGGGAPAPAAATEFLLAFNPFICDCQLDWMRRFHQSSNSARRTGSAEAAAQQLLMQLAPSYQNDQPPVITTSSSSSSFSSSSSTTSSDSSNNISEIQHHSHALQYGRIGDLSLVKCSPLFRRNGPRQQRHNNNNNNNNNSNVGRAAAPSDESTPNQPLARTQNNNQRLNFNPIQPQQQQQQQHQHQTAIDLITADSSNFLCRYKSHCYALCQCCEFDACDCEMICPAGCNCYYDSTWQTNLIDCSHQNHTEVPDRIPMDVTGLHLDGNNIETLRPSKLIARSKLKTLYLNATNLQQIANRTFNGLVELQTLYLHDNLLRSLNGSEFEPLAQLRALHLQSNRLDHISNQTFVYLRSLEILDLSNNRLTSANLDLFWSVGHHNIRLRQLSIAHNWWSCQCDSITRFRHILRQKFLLAGGVTIVDRNQLRCYYNATTVGPLILSSSPSSSSSSSSSSGLSGSIGSGGGEPIYGQSAHLAGATLLTEINQCSELPLDDSPDLDVNPPLIQLATEPSPPPPPPQSGDQDFYGGQSQPMLDAPVVAAPPPPSSSNFGPQMPDMFRTSPNGAPSQVGGPPTQRAGQMGLGSLLLGGLLVAAIMFLVLAGFVFIKRQQQASQRRRKHPHHAHHHHHHHHHHQSAASTSGSVSSSASSTAGSSSLNGLSGAAAKQVRLQQQQQQQLIISNSSSPQQVFKPSQQQQQPTHLHLHQHQLSNSSQSNIYAALVSPTTTNLAHAAHAAHATYASPSQPIYNQPFAESPYQTGGAAAAAATKSSTHSLYGYHAHNAHHHLAHHHQDTSAAEWVPRKLARPVKQFVSRLVDRVGGFRAAGAESGATRDEFSSSGGGSDKIYDAYISYDKRDEPFVMQHIAAELEYGQPQYRIADRHRDLESASAAHAAEAIASFIGCSQRTLVVLSSNYLASEWCRFELRAALAECAMDRSHRIIAVLAEPGCLGQVELEPDWRVLLGGLLHQQQDQQQQVPASQQLVQLADGPPPTQPRNNSSPDHFAAPATETHHFLTGGRQLVASLARDQQQVSASVTPPAKLALVHYGERKFWPRLKQLMPAPRHYAQTLTLTTKS